MITKPGLPTPLAGAIAEAAKKKQARAENFVRVANKRVKNTIRNLRNVSKLAGKHYVFDKNQTAKIVSTLRRELDAVEAAFASPTTHSTDPDFSL